MSDAVLRVNNLQTHFETRAGVLKAVDGVSFEVGRGRILGLVGMSGSGKSVTGSRSSASSNRPARSRVARFF